MPLFFRGFNLYDQVQPNRPLVDSFQEFFPDGNITNIWFNIFCSIVKIGDKLIYNGYYNKVFEEADINNENICEVALCDERFLFLNRSGEIYKIVNALNTLDVVPKLELDEGDKVIKIGCGTTINIAYSKHGCLFAIPNKLTFKSKDIVDIRCGKEHCLLLDSLGNLFSFGKGSRGQLGHGTLEDEEEPKQIEALAGIKINKISTGFWHSCAVSKDGDLYTWGWNGNGQLGLDDSNEATKDSAENSEKCVAVMATPHLVDFPNDLNVSHVDCGSRHTVVILENNAVYGCGWNKYKQLNNEETENFYKFTYIHDVGGKTISTVVCGPWCTSILCN